MIHRVVRTIVKGMLLRGMMAVRRIQYGCRGCRCLEDHSPGLI